MKKILLFIVLLSSLVSFGQLMPTIPRVTNINQRYQWLEGRFWNVLDMPYDSIYSKNGFIQKSGRPYYGDGIQWYPFIRSITTNLQAGDEPRYDANGDLYNVPPDPASCNNGANIPLSYISGTTYAYGTGPYTISCNPYTIDVGGTITLNPGNTTSDSARTDAIILTSSGISVKQGDNYALGQVATPTIDPASEILLTYVTFTASNSTPDNVAINIVYSENAPTGEWAHALFGGPTVAFNYTTLPYLGDSAIRWTGAPNNSRIVFTYSSDLNQNSLTNLSGWINNLATFNTNRNWVIRLLYNGLPVPGSIAVTLNASKGYNKTLLNSWQNWSIRMDAFGGNFKFNGFEIRNTGTGGTVNVKMDYITFQSGIVISNPPTSTAPTQFETVAELRASDTYLSGTQFASTQGYWLFGDGGGALYHWSPSSVLADNGGAILKPNGIPSGSPGRWLMAIQNHTVNVKQFGAKGDGTTDDRAAFLAAYAALPRTLIALNQWTRGKIIVPQPDSAYKWSDSLLIDDQITIEGQTGGAYPFNVIKIQVASGKSGIKFAHGALGGGATACVMNNLSFIGLGSNTDTTKDGVESNGQIFLNNIHVENFGGNGIYLNTTVSGNVGVSRVDNCGGQQNGLNGLSLDGGETSTVIVTNPNFQFNQRFNIYDNGFLGNTIQGGHVAGGGARSGYSSESVVTHGGNYFIAHYPNQNVEPSVTSGWELIWEDLGVSFDIPGSVSAWNSSTVYKGGGPTAQTGATQAGTITGIYIEGGAGKSISTGFNLKLGGVNADNFNRLGLTLENKEDWLDITSGAGVRVRWDDPSGSTTNNFYTQLGMDEGLEFKWQVEADESKNSVVQMRMYSDSTMHIFSSNVDNVPRMLFTGKELTHAGFHLSQPQVSGLPIIGKTGLGFLSVNSASAFSANDDIGMISMGSTYPGNEGLSFRKGFIVVNTEIPDNDTLMFVANQETPGGVSAHWDRILKSGGGGSITAGYGLTGITTFKVDSNSIATRARVMKSIDSVAALSGGGGLPTGLSWDNTAKEFGFGGSILKSNAGNYTRIATDGTVLQLLSLTGTVEQDIYNGALDTYLGLQYNNITAHSPLTINFFNSNIHTTGSGASTELVATDGAGNNSTISPHTQGLLPYKLKKLGWTFNSTDKNENQITVDMLKAMETIERQSKEIEELKEMVYQLTGKKYEKKKPVKLIYKKIKK